MADLTGLNLKNQFFLRRLVGQGGMADVYEAWDRQRSVRLAVKVLRRDLIHNTLLTSEFAKEVDLVKRLTHPNIVRFYEQGEEPPDLVYFVMDFVEGQNLRDAMAARAKFYSPAEISEILKPVCTALQYAHQEHIFHCDIKPANILLDGRGQVLLSDFGIARFTNETSQSGTPPYMAPEQFLRMPVGPYTDIYSLGVMMFELLGGRLPFQGETGGSQGTTRQRIGWEHIYQPLPSLARLNPQVQPALEQVIARALNKEPGERYQSVIALLNDFERVRSTPNPNISYFGTAVRAPDFPTYSPPPPPKANPNPPPLPAKTNLYANAGQPPEPQAAPKLREAHLLCLEGEIRGRIIEIPLDGLTIGRSSQNRLCLSEASVSRYHAVLFKTRSQYIIKDLGSTLGTGLNRMVLRNQDCAIHANDIIRIGYEQVFQFILNGQRP